MLDENVVDREVGLEVMRRGLATREALLPLVQQRRSDPSRSFATVLVLNGVITPELGSELDRLARERAAGQPPPPPPAPPAPGVGDRSPSGRIAGLGDRSPSGRILPPVPEAGVGDRTASGRQKRATGSHVNLSMPQHTVMDLDLEVPPAGPSASDPDARNPNGGAPTPPPRPGQFQAARTFVDADLEVPDGGRTMLEEPLEMPAPEGGRTMLENLEMPADGPAAAPAPVPAANAPIEETRRPPAAPSGRRAVQQGSPAVLTPGKYFGDYEVISTLGEGAMGQVFRAKRRSDGLEVALKVMRGGLVASAKVRERFLREAKAAKLIQHPNVVTFIDAGMIASDQFLAMEFVDGRSLQAVLNEKPGKPLPMGRAFELYRQILAGLAAAHDAGVIHRDLKPENILITRGGEIPKITDFGLARREEESMLLTRPGQIMGSPYYMAPEQGQGLPVDARADLYSLGAILFCLVTGRVPFPFPSATEVIHAHCELERPDPRSVNPEVGEELAAYVLRLLAINPDARPQTAKAALQEFEDLAARASVADAPPPSQDPDAPPPSSDEDDFYSGPELVDAFPSGTRVGRLTIEGVIGAGGMGAVYRARHDENRVSALKVLPQKLAADPKRVKSFLREAELGKKVHSPNVVETFDYGNDPSQGVAYIELEYVQGTSVDNLIKTGVLQQESLIINILRGCAQGLAALHGAGIIHRDIKPANLLLSGEFLSRPDGGVKIIDMGLAIEKENVKKSGDDAFAGTPLYMPPEQAMKDGTVDERSDLYALGCAIYHLACGKTPFDGKTPAAIAYQHQRTTAVSPKTHNSTLTDGFSAIIELLLAKNPDDRYNSAAALIADLAKTDADGKLKKPEIHAKYRTNRLGKAGEKFAPLEGHKEDSAPPPRRLVIGAAIVAIVCGLMTLVQVGRALFKSSNKNNTVDHPTPPPPPPPPPPGHDGTTPTDPNKQPDQVKEKTEAERQRELQDKIDDLRSLARQPAPDWLEVRHRYEAIIKEYPDAALQGIAKNLKEVSDTFDAAIADARKAAQKAHDTRSSSDWSECDQNISIAKQQISRDGDQDTLQRAQDDIDRLRR